MTIYLLALVLALLLGWLLIRRRRARIAAEAASRATYKPEDTRFHAVSIRFETYACEAAKALEGRRFLADAAPRLPLAECNATECKCRFVHHKDRRSGRDRRSPFGSGQSIDMATGKHRIERREGKDRRAEPDDNRY